ncbi:MAG TPA: TonB-dependent receptor plug domain-containing protein, partial [Chitinophagaceae bacterium]|nr:TonB-dependent receptor plug domain-containing protein [Chitinophagaceae bacterium]
MSISLAFAQTRTITGKVTDDKSNPLAGVNVTVKGTTTATQTKDDGTFMLVTDGNAKVLVVTAVGMGTREITLGSDNSVSVRLTPQASDLQEVVVTALGLARDKRSLGYATQSIKAEQLADKGEVNLVNALQGRVAGVNITQASGGAGASTNINIRGITSFNGNNQPLFIVDGIPISNNVDRTNGGTLGTLGDAQPPNRAIDLDLNNIETINILKGPAASVLYGSRAASGAIVITTKKGGSGKGKTEIIFNSSYSVQKATGLAEMQNDYGQGLNGVFNPISGNSWGPRFGSTPTVANGLLVNGAAVPYQAYPNNIQNFYETGTLADNSLLLNGGDLNQNYTFSIGNVGQRGIIPSSSFARTNVKFGGNATLRGKIKVGGSVSYINTRQVGPIQGNGSSATGQLINVTRSTDLDFWKNNYKNANGTNNWYIAGSDNPYFDSYENPIKSNLTRFLGNI